MKYPVKISSLLLAFVLLTLAACGGGGAPATPTVDAAAVFTQSAQTAIVMQTQTAMAATPTPTATNTPDPAFSPTATHTPLTTETPSAGTPSVTPLVLNTPRPASSSSTSCDNVNPSITDVTIPDNTEIPAGSSFVKTWGFTNAGPCAWDQDYLLIYSYDSDNGITGWSKTPSVNFPGSVDPGETVQISITLVAPTEAGTYRGVYRLQNSDGYNFGPEFWVQIVVK